MISRSLPTLLLIAGILAAAAPAGCNNTKAVAPAAPTRVLVSHPVEKEITDYTDFTGSVTAVDSVEIRARVFGFLEKVNFKEGDLVKKGDILYQIDPRTYQAIVNQAKAKVETDEATARYNTAAYNRNVGLAKTGAVSKDELEQSLASRDQYLSTVIADKANLASNELDLYFTKVTAPVDGRIGRILVTVGNLVQSSQNSGGTLLTTIVSVDPVYCLFNVDQGTVLKMQALIREGKVKSARGGTRPVLLALANETGFPHSGLVDFVNNSVDTGTGTLQLRGVFPNKDGSLIPGMFARVRVPLGNPHKAILISERAIDTDQGQKIIYLVDAENKVSTRAVKLGPIQDGMRVIENITVKEGDKTVEKPAVDVAERVIVEGLQQVKVDSVVDPKLVPMPAAATGRGPSEMPK